MEVLLLEDRLYVLKVHGFSNVYVRMYEDDDNSLDV